MHATEIVLLLAHFVEVFEENGELEHYFKMLYELAMVSSYRYKFKLRSVSTLIHYFRFFVQRTARVIF